MEYLVGFKYAFKVIWYANIFIFAVACVTSIFEYITGNPILIRKLFIPKEEKLIEAGPRVLSFMYFSFNFLFLITDAYISHHAPDEFYYFQWLLIITPLTFCLKYLADKVQWRPD